MPMTRFILCATLLAAPIAALPVWAQDIDLNTPAGPAQIVDGADGSRALALGSRRVDLPGAPAIAFIEARQGNLLLVLLSQGGNACPAEWVWVHAVPGDLRMSEVFGTCADEVTVSHDAETVRVTMAGFDPGKGDVTFVYDGRGPVRRQQADVAPSGMATWDDWGWWQDRYPFELLAARDMRPGFVAMMGKPAYQTALEWIARAGPLERDGDWIAAAGWQPSSDSEARGAVALNLVDGRRLVALWQAGAAPRLWGDPGPRMPAAIAAIMARP